MRCDTGVAPSNSRRAPRRKPGFPWGVLALGRRWGGHGNHWVVRPGGGLMNHALTVNGFVTLR